MQKSIIAFFRSLNQFYLSCQVFLLVYSAYAIVWFYLVYFLCSILLALSNYGNTVDLPVAVPEPAPTVLPDNIEPLKPIDPTANFKEWQPMYNDGLPADKPLIIKEYFYGNTRYNSFQQSTPSYAQAEEFLIKAKERLAGDVSGFRQDALSPEQMDAEAERLKKHVQYKNIEGLYFTKA
jgi:hypothetical protein